MIYWAVKAIFEWILRKRSIFSKKEDSFLMSSFLSSYFSFQTRADLVLVKFCYNAAVRRFLKTFRKFAGKRLLWKPILGKFKLLKMDLGNDVFLSVFQTVSLKHWKETHSFEMITFFGANSPDSSNICQKVEAFSYEMHQNTYERDFSLYLQTLRIF